MISLKQFTGQKITAKDDALLYEWLSQNAACVFFGCEVTSLGANQMRITSGRGIILGRTFEVQQEDFTAQLADPGQSWKGRVYIEIDLSNTPQPIAIKTVAAVSLSPLVQEDINSDGNIYQFALANYDASDIEASNIKIAFSATPEYYPAAQKLLTPRKIGLANFDGTADITVDQIGAMPKTGGSFSDIVRFYGPNYPQLGFMTTTNNSGGLYFAVCGEDRAYKDYIIKSLLSGTKITTSLNGEATRNIPKKAKSISNWKSITESGFYFAAAGSTGNPVSGVAFMGFIFIYDNNNHFGIGRACQGDYSNNKLYFTNGYQPDNIKWVQM